MYILGHSTILFKRSFVCFSEGRVTAREMEREKSVFHPLVYSPDSPGGARCNPGAWHGFPLGTAVSTVWNLSLRIDT